MVRQALLVLVLLMAGFAVTAGAGTYYSLGGTGDVVNTNAEYQFANRVTIGGSTLQASDRLLVNGPIRISDGGTQPACSNAAQTYRGMIWFEQSCSGSKDCLQVCAFDAGGTLAWRALW